MTLKQLEAEVLALPKDSLVALLARLLEHLSQLSEIDKDVERVWTQEAEARDREIDDGQVTGIPAEDVFQQIRASWQ
ncbi:addiction module protein [Coleofasciculus sp. E2-BRE-01]|uniref:addiction module protein n=1 Tax=Coleofasciculus sp. E2-BRE-01 TaxID=3069524 RepID=UPI0032F0B4D4